MPINRETGSKFVYLTRLEQASNIPKNTRIFASEELEYNDICKVAGIVHVCFIKGSHTRKTVVNALSYLPEEEYVYAWNSDIYDIEEYEDQRFDYGASFLESVNQLLDNDDEKDIHYLESVQKVLDNIVELQWEDYIKGLIDKLLDHAKDSDNVCNTEYVMTTSRKQNRAKAIVDSLSEYLSEDKLIIETDSKGKYKIIYLF